MLPFSSSLTSAVFSVTLARSPAIYFFNKLTPSFATKMVCVLRIVSTDWLFLLFVAGVAEDEISFSEKQQTTFLY